MIRSSPVNTMFDEDQQQPTYYYSSVDYSIGRKFAVTASGLMGLVHMLTKVGDLVTLLGRERSCFVLRPEEGKEWMEEEEDENFELVGEAHFHGLIEYDAAIMDKEEEEDDKRTEKIEKEKEKEKDGKGEERKEDEANETEKRKGEMVYATINISACILNF